ncbi:MAG: toll/interleukin-1 receptor domain-containing protein [Thermodesulfobacteriota bacterium]
MGMVFVSHANPEDNEFSRWLSLQLARAGYGVWCDLTKLLGGETFWRDIETVIRERTAKFVYVLSRTSNQKEGPLAELHVALNVARDRGLQDFVIPVHIDDLPHREINIQISRLNTVEFSRGWAGGLGALLQKMELDRVPKDRRFDPGAVSAWWRTNMEGREIVQETPEEYFSNWFPIVALPEVLYLHRVGKNPALPAELPYPSHRVGEFLASFAPETDLGLTACSDSVLVSPVLEDRTTGVPVGVQERRNAVNRLLSLAWKRACERRGLPTYLLANDRAASYFLDRLLPKKILSFRLQDGFEGRRGLTGASTVRSLNAPPGESKKRHWHFALSADVRFWPSPAYVVKSHVLFSDDGENIWTSKDRLHRFRRTQCKDWWNDTWRDRILCSLSWLAEGAPTFSLPVSASTSVEVRREPLRFESPVSYGDEHARRDLDWDRWMDDDEFLEGSDTGEVPR